MEQNILAEMNNLSLKAQKTQKFSMRCVNNSAISAISARDKESARRKKNFI